MSSMGEIGATSSSATAEALNSGLKLSLPTIGGMEGGAAIVDVVDLDDEAAVSGGHS